MAARRPGTTQASSVSLTTKLTPRERRRSRWLARKRKVTESELFRMLLAEECDRLEEAGETVPKR